MNGPTVEHIAAVDWTDGPVRVLIGSALERLRDLPNDSVHCTVTSPPYWGLRSYLPAGHESKTQELGAEATPAEYVADLVEVLREVRRVLRPDGTAWVNVADSYAHGGNGSRDPILWPKQSRNGHGFRSVHAKGPASGLKPKDLALVPERLAIALQDDGWWIRSRIAWAKTSPMPESVRDRPTSAWEHVWLLAKREAYYFDQDAVRESVTRGAAGSTFTNGKTGVNGLGRTSQLPRDDPAGRNMRNFWLLGPEPYPDAHFACFPSEIPRRAIAAGTSERGCCPECGAPQARMVERQKASRNGEGLRNGRDGGLTAEAGLERTGLSHFKYNEWLAAHPPQTTGWRPTCRHDHDPIPCTVLDPFVGSGTTLAVARRMGRQSIGIELNPDYLPLIQRRVAECATPLLESPVEQIEQVELFDRESA